MTSRFLRLTSLAGGAVAAGLFAGSALAHDGESHLADMIEQADLVFAGEVASIEYALSQPCGQEGSRVAYTFVTYRVDSVLRGNDPGHLLTLRFIGGLNRDRGTYLRASNAPQFDLGDQDIMFVKDNASALVPLVEEDGGRLRMIDGLIYTEYGQSVRLGEDGEIVKGARFLLEDVATTDVAGQRFVDDLGPQALQGKSDAMGAMDLLAEIADAADALPRVKIDVAQADASMPFDGPDLMPAAPPAMAEEDGRDMKAADSREARELRALEAEATERAPKRSVK